MTAFDRRLTPARGDLAAEHLRGTIKAERYVEGTRRRIAAPVVDMRPEPRNDLGIDTQLVFGEAVTVYEETAEGWAWVQNEADGYVGWISSDVLADPSPEPSHVVAVPRSFVYPVADMKHPVRMALGLGSKVMVTGTVRVRDLDYGLLAGGGAMVLKHLKPATEAPETDFVAVAGHLIGTPYLWGGRTPFGIDCSGLVQASLASCGVAAPRDSDMQAGGLGEVLAVAGDDLPALRRGDLLFWKGHVAIAMDAERMIHASGHHMMVVTEPIGAALARIAAAGSPLTGVRRIAGAPVGAQ
ncbi:Gamma-D-glutamyl-L-lysine endopeptidase [Hartmannibacter diazotrophicus]|uniref:Gamma-D-glutamyl-L-lysine endopeptidase n=1 Tax=Hartmannibacter diazotrophicus TaxID=1482074 RepID=A0A2C9D077_9HYPH|nr:NlpC/P60 family protein [Hartmannibacter diazotrophicus]SON53644.1 Gamma-D-glutamyl-L-lysine endopeptidase [Hartmannibacter diazotrophicus]